LFEKSACLDNLLNSASGKANFRRHHRFMAEKFNVTQYKIRRLDARGDFSNRSQDFRGIGNLCVRRCSWAGQSKELPAVFCSRQLFFNGAGAVQGVLLP
jgi:hypothetical protein